MKIGGHVGLLVYRGRKGVLKKINRDTDEAEGLWEVNKKGLHNEAKFLKLLEESGFTPKLFREGKEYIYEEDIGEGTPITDMQNVRRECCRALIILNQQQIRHQDLSWVNVVIEDNHPWFLDWQEARFYGQPAPKGERWDTDTELLWKWMCQIKDHRGVNDESRIVRRWCAVLGALKAVQCQLSPLGGETFLDLGCFQGDHVAMARAEGMAAEGVDHGGFRTGEDSIAIANGLWGGTGCEFTKVNILESPSGYLRRDVVVMFSTWAWLVKNSGKEVAYRILRQAINESGVFFFETQLYGDGPGPEFLKTDEDVNGLLRECGASHVESLVTIPVYGRPASRTVWEVKS